MNIIAICGTAGAGKSTLATQLTFCGYTRMPFARPIKLMLSVLLHEQGAKNIRRMLWGDLKEEPSPFLAGRTPRYAMQTLGSEWRDLMGRELWTSIWKATLENKSPQRVVVDDLRFMHEANTIRSLGGVIISVCRDGYMPGTHISEVEYTTICPDLMVVNNEDLPNEMIEKVKSYLHTTGREGWL